jgi:hypothetical protein
LEDRGQRTEVGGQKSEDSRTTRRGDDPPASPEGEADPPAMPEQGDGGQVAGRHGDTARNSQMVN